MKTRLSALPGTPRRRQKMLLAGLVVLLVYMVLPWHRKENDGVAAYDTGRAIEDERAIAEELSRAFARVGSSRKTGAKAECPNYGEYAKLPHYKEGAPQTPLNLPYQRPPEQCRTFTSPAVETFIKEFVALLKDPDLAILFENTFPNTLDTTILWHGSREETRSPQPPSNRRLFRQRKKQPETFIVTGDIHAEWLRDSAWQLSVYQRFIKSDPALRELIRGAINTQAGFVKGNPYCNAFHPPPYSGVERGRSSIDDVLPQPNWEQVFECKYEIDSLASFLTLSRQYYENAPEDSRFDFITEDWLAAVREIMKLVKAQSKSTFTETGHVQPVTYKFQRNTKIASETLPLAGTGNPVNRNTGLVRSAFRPSDDATIFQFFVPGNAYMAVELERLTAILQGYLGDDSPTAPSRKMRSPFSTDILALIEEARQFAERIRAGIMEHAVFDHPQFGEVFAYEVDGYGSHLFMDDANIPSLLSLPDLGFVSKDDPVYRNTRKMILSPEGNPYYLNGEHFQGIGGPHIGLHNSWPMSLLVRIRTSDYDDEILHCLDMVMKNTGNLGLIHESVRAFHPDGLEYTRSWFAWANSEFAKTVLDLAERKPHLIFKEDNLAMKFSLDVFLAKTASVAH
ncbi:AaceriAFR430Cp [[Ashbya] aceris (nom. inval.)]|nr:AaceriAFR430Cp [[Ashbya] aceris (nom. inval.)]